MSPAGGVPVVWVPAGPDRGGPGLPHGGQPAHCGHLHCGEQDQAPSHQDHY